MVYNKYRSSLDLCYEKLLTNFTQNQAFEIITVMLSIVWIKKNSNYSDKALQIIDKFNEIEFADNFKNALLEFEEEYPEFRSIFTGLIDNVINYPDLNINRNLRNVYLIINNMDLDIQKVKDIFLLILSSDAEYNRSNDTPDSVVELMYKLLDFEIVKQMAVYCCGYSKIAITFMNNLRAAKKLQLLEYYGEELILSTTLVSKLLMIIFELDNSKIENKDVLRIEGIQENGNRYDLVISDMPQVAYSENRFAKDDNRLNYGYPIKNSAEWVFGQNVIYNMNSNGIGILIGTKGTLVRGSEEEIRRNIIEKDLIECVITLPNNLYEKSNLGTELIIINKNKPQDRKDKVLFINASGKSMRVNRMQHAITKESIDQIVISYKNGIEEDNYSKFVDKVKIKNFKYRLNPVEYLDFDVLKESLSNTVRLEDIAIIYRGLNVKKEDITEENYEGAYLCLNVKEIENGRVNYNSASSFRTVKKEWIGRYDIKQDDIIVTSKGWSVKFAIVENSFKPSLISSNLTIIRVNPKKYNPYVLLEFFQSEIGAKMLEGIHTGTTVKVLNNSQLQNFEIPIFSIDDMNRIGEKIKCSRDEYENSIQKAKEKFEKNKEEYTDLLRLYISKDKH